MTDEPWLSLKTGERFQVGSHSGRLYEATFLSLGKDDAGLYVRLADGRLARFSPKRLVWPTLKRMGPGEVLVSGDEVLVETTTGEEVRGKVAAPPTDQLVVRVGAKVATIPLDTVDGGLRLLFAASDVKPGDEVIVRSRSGREYRGRALGVEPERITVRLHGGSEGMAPVALRSEQLDLTTLYVLVPLAATELGCATPSG